jgi:tRNA modification GTPase
VNSSRDTIAAIATGLGGGIGIVRLSGPDAERIVARLVDPWPRRPQSHRLYFGRAIDPQTREAIDEVLACLMRAPRSYTGEDVAELHGHGGRLVCERVLAVVLAEGARLAQPGEFTRRAFESGRIDLTRAEAVAELIGARSDRALRAAQSLHAGALEREVRSVRSQLVGQLAELEGAIDFPDDANDARPESETANTLGELVAKLRALAATYRKLVHEGAEVVLLGRVNAGKSSLLNALAGEERALVDSEAGTTRDLVEVEVDLGGVSARLVDTAGDRFGEAGGAASPSIEQRGLELARRRRGRADAAVMVVDGTVGIGAGELQLWQELSGGPRILAWNKRDVASAPSRLPEGARAIETSARTGEGVADLKRAIVDALGGLDEDAGALVVSLRQKEALLSAAALLERARETLRSAEPSELAAVDGRAALNELGRVTGETVDAELLDAIFARFCIGK